MRTIIADTSALYALVDADDAHHAEAVAFLKHTGKRLTLVVPETTLIFLTIPRPFDQQSTFGTTPGSPILT